MSVVTEVMMVRDSVWLTNWSSASAGARRLLASKRSRMRSKTTTVSFSG
jgi:hypothetical protein